MKGQKVDEETDSACLFEGKVKFHLLQMKTPRVTQIGRSVLGCVLFILTQQQGVGSTCQCHDLCQDDIGRRSDTRTTLRQFRFF